MGSMARTLLAITVAVLLGWGAWRLVGGPRAGIREGVRRGPEAGETVTPESRPLARSPEPETEEAQAPVETRESAQAAERQVRYLLSGRVIAPEGLSTLGARYLVRELEPEGEERFTHIAGLDEHEGFRLRVGRPGRFVLWAVPLQGGASEFVEVVLDAEHPEASVNLELTRIEPIEGVVLTADMQPVAGAEVVAYVELDAGDARLPDGLTAADRFGRPRALTDPEGRFKLEPAFTEGALFSLHAQTRQRRSRTLRTGAAPESLRFELWTGEMRNVPGGSSHVNLIVGPPEPSAARLVVTLSTPKGVALPDRVRWQLRTLGPRGEVYFERSDILAGGRDELVVENLDVQQRYDVVLRDTSGRFAVVLEPFVAVSGETRLEARFEGPRPILLRFRDPHRRLAHGFDLKIHSADPRGEDHQVVNVVRAERTSEYEAHLPPGHYRLELMRVEPSGAVTAEVMLDASFEVEEGVDEAWLEVP